MAALLFASSLLYRACQAWEPRFAAQAWEERPLGLVQVGADGGDFVSRLQRPIL